MPLTLAPTKRMFNSKGAQINPFVPPPESIFNPQTAYPAAIKTQGGDYDDIMSRYRSIAGATTTANTGQFDSIMSQYANLNSGNPLQYEAVNPEQQVYSQTGDVSSALASLKGLSKTGGYSDEDVSNIRER